MKKMCKVISVVSWKGGVGKTTSTVNISSYLWMQGKKVCVVDLDPQHSLSKHFGIFPGHLKERPTIYDLLNHAIEDADEDIEDMISDLRERYHTGNNLMAVVKSYDEEADTVAISVKDAAPHPFDGADARHPVRSHRASSITGKYKGGVFCKLEENLDCLCTYSPSQYDENFNVGDEVIIAITKFDYRKKQVYGKIVAKW